MGENPQCQLVKGLTLFRRLKPVHNELHQQYQALLDVRADLINGSISQASNLNAHACMSRDYAKTLLKLCKPARGRLAALLSESCAAGLMYSLLYDLCSHLNHYIVSEDMPHSESGSVGRPHPCKNDPSPRNWFSMRAGGAIKHLLDQLEDGKLTEAEAANGGLFMPDIRKNYHYDFENFIDEEDKKYAALKTSKVEEVSANDGVVLHSREILPTVGVLSTLSEPVDEEPVELALLAAGLSRASSWIPWGSTTLPDSLEEYMDQFGVFIIVALDKLETKMKLPKEMRNSCLKVLLQSFLFVAKFSDSDKLSRQNRLFNYLSPRFFIEMADVLSLFDEGFDKERHSACSYYRGLNSSRACQQWLCYPSQLQQSSGSEIFYPNPSAETTDSESECGYLVHLSNYLYSLFMKSLLNEVESAIENKKATSAAVRYSSTNLSDVLDSLTDDRFQDVFISQECGHRLAYSCSVTFFMFSLSPLMIHQKVAFQHNNFFPLLCKQMEKLPNTIDVSGVADESEKDSRLISHAVADLICDSFFTVLVFGAKPRSTCYDRYMKTFFRERLPTGLEHAIPFLSSKSAESTIKKLGKIVKNIKCDRSWKNKGPGSTELVTRDHHVGTLGSPLYTSYEDPAVCTVATFTKLLLVLYRCGTDDTTSMCLDTMQEVGLCCCFDSEFILKDILPNLSVKSQDMVAKSLNFLESVFMGTLNGARLAPFPHCKECSLASASVTFDSSVDGPVDLLLTSDQKSHGFSRTICYEKVSSIANRWFSGDKKVVCYGSLKWAGIRNYTAFKDKFDPTFQEHISRLARFGRKEIQCVLLDFVYEPILDSLKDLKVVNEILRNPSRVSALPFIFSGLSVVLLANSELSLSMSDSFWKMWDKMVQPSQTVSDGSLLRPCYELACAAVLSHLSVNSKKEVPPFPKKLEPHSECLKVLESSILDVQSRWTELLARSTVSGLATQAASVAAVWSCLAEFCCLPRFVRFLEQRFFKAPTQQSSALNPLKTLKQLLKCLADKESKLHDELLSCSDSTFDLVRSLLKVISICPTWQEHRPAAVAEVKAALHLHLLSSHIQPLMFAVLDVSCSANANQNGGRLWATSAQPQSRYRDQAGTISAYFAALDPAKYHVALWPELVEEVISALVYRTSLIVNQLEQARVEVERKCKAEAKAKQTPEEGLFSSTVSSPWSYFAPSATDAVDAVEELEDAEYFSDSDDEAGIEYHDKEDLDEESDVTVMLSDSQRICKDRLEEVIQLLEESLAKVIEVCEDEQHFEQLYHVRVQLMDKLLQGFDKVLRNSHKFGGVAGLVVRLWARFASSGITTQQLADFLKIFMGKRPPVDDMLSTLESLLLESMKTPLSYLQFTNTSVRPQPASRPVVPVLYTGYDLNLNPKAPGARVPLHGFVTKRKNLSESIKNFCKYRADIIDEKLTYSGVSQARLACLLPYENQHGSWVPFISDTTVAFWCQLDRDNRLNGPVDFESWNENEFQHALESSLHVFTVGVTALMASAFLCARTGHCHLEFYRKTSEVEMCYRVAACELDFRKFMDGSWHFVTLSLPAVNTKKAADFQVSYSVDGLLSTEEVSLPPMGGINYEAPFILLGHRGLVFTDKNGAPPKDTDCFNIQDSLAISSFTMWSKPTLDHLSVLLLMSFGKDVKNYLGGQREASADLLKNFMTVEMVDYLTDHCSSTQISDFFCGRLQNSVLNLNKTLLLHFNSHHPEEFVFYDSVAKNSGLVPDECGKYSSLSTRYTIHFEGYMDPVRQQGALQALLHLGGASALLYLLARVVELNTVDYAAVPRATGTWGRSFLKGFDQYVDLTHYSGDFVLGKEDEKIDLAWSTTTSNPGRGSCQAVCLKLLYSCIRKDPQLCRQFHELKGTEMVMRLLCSPKMDTRLEVFKVLLDQCFSDSLISLDEQSVLYSMFDEAPVQGTFTYPNPRLLVTDAPLLAVLLQHWHALEIRKRDARNSAYDSLVQKADPAMSAGAPNHHIHLKESLDSPESLVSHWRAGHCHLVDVLHLAVVSVLSREDSIFHALNYQLMHRFAVLEKCINIAMELHVRDLPAFKVKPMVLKELFAAFVPPKRTDVPYWNMVNTNLQSAFVMAFELLLLSLDPHMALRWNARTCTSRLCNFTWKTKITSQVAMYERMMRNLVNTELAEEVTEDLSRLIPALDATVAAEECLGVLTLDDDNKLAAHQGYSNMFDASNEPETEQNQTLKTAGPKITTSEAPETKPAQIETELAADGRSVLTGEVALACGEAVKLETDNKEVIKRPCSPEEADVEVLRLLNGLKSDTDRSSSGRNSPQFSEPYMLSKSDYPQIYLDSEYLLTTLYDFLNLQDGKGLGKIIENTLVPGYLAIFANHECVGVRHLVVKIFKDVIYRCTRDVRSSFVKQLVVISHQLSCHDSSTLFLTECFHLMVSVPADHSELSTSLDLITSLHPTTFQDDEVQQRLLSYSSPLLSVLPKLNGVDVKCTMMVLDFLSAVVRSCHRSAACDKLLAMTGLGEALLLTIDASLSNATTLDAAPVINLFTDLVRSLLLLGDRCVERGFDLITKCFVFCGQYEDNRKTAVCMSTMAKVLVNSLKSILEAMLVASTSSLEAVLESKKMSPAYSSQIVKEEKEKRRSFIPNDRHSSYYVDYLEESSLPDRVGSSSDRPDFVERAIELLRLASNLVTRLDWSTSGACCWSLPLFLFDLNLSMLRSLDALPTPAGNANFAGKLKQPLLHQFERLSLEYETEVRSFLPMLVCSLLNPTADRLARRSVLSRFNTCHKLVLLCCRAAHDKIYNIVCYFLWMNKQIFVRSELSRVFCQFESVLEQFDFKGDADNFELSMMTAFNLMRAKRIDSADSTLELCVETCSSAVVAEHKEHEKAITSLYNKFLVKHSTLKRKVFERVNVAGEKYSLQSKSWMDLCTACSGPLSPWRGKTSLWWELVEFTNQDRTRSLLMQKSFNVGKQFFAKKSSKHPLKRLKPLESVLGTDYEIQAMEQIGDLESSFEKSDVEVSFTGKAWVIKPGIECWGTIFLVTKVGISFKGKKTVFGWSTTVAKSVDSVFHVYFAKMVSVKKRSYRLKQTAFEVYLVDRVSLFFVCDKEQERDEVVNLILKEASLEPEKAVHEEVAVATAAWQSRKMSNFDYLMQLNNLAGRNYNDLNQYPVFPFVLADYTSEVLDLNDPNSFRDLSKPMPAQTKEREEFFAGKYKERLETDIASFGASFHYTSLYSNSVIVKTYLVRLPPFTVYFLYFQGGRFDHPSRTFHSVQKTYDLITKDTFSDFKEAIPEMYYLPEIFSNEEEFNMKGDEANNVDKVILPPWCQGDPRKFVLYHRAALESDYVTENLPQWIDLIFGFKQCGKKCVEVFNKYHPSGYSEHLGAEGVPEELYTNMTGMYGEVPRQLLKSAHLKPHKEAMKMLTNEFLEVVSPSASVKGVRWGCFAYFPALPQSNMPVLPSAGNTTVVGPHQCLVMTGKVDQHFLSADLDTLLIPDHDTGEFFHMLRVSPCDGVVRAWSHMHTVPYTLTALPAYTKVTYCSAEGRQVWLGTDCGQVILYRLKVNPPSDSLNSVQCLSTHILQGHSAPVTAINVCQNFNICLTGDSAGNCCVWDVCTPALVRRVSCFSSRVTRVLVSKTSGDWMCLTDGGTGDNLLHPAPDTATSALKLFTLNGDLVAECKLPEPVRCLAMTSLTGGLNVIAVATSSLLTLFSSWDLQKLKETTFSPSNPIDLMRWSDDSQHLAVQWNSGQCSVYRSPTAVSRGEPLKTIKVAKLKQLLAQ